MSDVIQSGSTAFEFSKGGMLTRILQVGTGFFPIPPSGAGAAETAIYNISRCLSKRGHEVCVIDVEGGQRDGNLFLTRSVSHHFRSRNAVEHALAGLEFGFLSSLQLLKLLKRGNFDVVHFHNQFSGLWGIQVAKHFEVPSVYTVHSAAWGLERSIVSLKNRLMLGQEIACMKTASRVIVVSESLGECVTTRLRISPEKVSVIPNGIDTEVFKPCFGSSHMKTRIAPKGEIVFLNVARVARYKNQLTLLRAFALLKEKAKRAKLVLVGPIDDRVYFSEIRNVIYEYNLENSVVIFGLTSFETLLELYSSADVVVFPSITEGLPLAILEAMACGKAIVASDIGPNRELLEGVGILVDPGDPKAIALSLSTIMDDGDKRQEIGNRVRAIVTEKYRWEAVSSRIEQLYAELASKGD